MKNNTPPALRAVYIVLVPIVLLIILLNSGYLQRWVTAATVHGKSYKVVDYNYYYFDCYNDFLEENELRLDELGYDPEVEDSKQYYDADTTWKEFFQAQAEANLSETAYYCDLAEADGYQFSEEELAPVADKLAENEAFYTSYNLSAKNYYISYYGSGMTEELYTEHLTNQVRASAYKSHLLEAMEPDQTELDQLLTGQQGADYQSVRLSVITLEALPDRETGEVGEAQLDALERKLGLLAERYQSGVGFEQLQSAFSTCALGDAQGVVAVGTFSSLPQVLANWCLTDQDALVAGDTISVVDTETGIAYFAVLDGLGNSGVERDAVAELNGKALEAQETQAVAADYTVDYNSFGMLLATG